MVAFVARLAEDGLTLYSSFQSSVEKEGVAATSSSLHLSCKLYHGRSLIPLIFVHSLHGKVG